MSDGDLRKNFRSHIELSDHTNPERGISLQNGESLLFPLFPNLERNGMGVGSL